jgi:radical SAM protein with 4Fe4S-binding SPASM domain
MEASIIVTYRCINRCRMCNTWKFPTSAQKEFKPSLLEKLPDLSFCNITGGEPFLRDDIEEIIYYLRRKSGRIVISTNGYYTEKILEAVKKYRDIGIRVSIEGLPAINDGLRGLKDCFDHGLRTLLELKRLNIKDVGFGITISDKNAEELMDVYDLSRHMKMEFATAIVHNSYYFHTEKNTISDKECVTFQFEKLIKQLLKSGKPKDWFRAYFNHGIINYIQGNKRLLPCESGTENFFVDPYGEILPCNGMEDKYWFDTMGNLNINSFDEIWNSKKAETVRQNVKNCEKNCWMIGSVSPVMKKYFSVTAKWVIKNKFFKNNN